MRTGRNVTILALALALAAGLAGTPAQAQMNAQVSAYYNVVKPDTVPAADWQLRLQLQLLFPE